MNLFITIVLLSCVIVLGDWRNWKSYHPTMLYIALCNLTYNFITGSKKLWVFVSPFLGHNVTDALYIFVVTPAIAFLFLSKYPPRHRLVYILGFAIAFSLIEWIQHEAGFITYQHGWSFGWSVQFYLVMFPMLRLHHRLPVVAYVLSVGITYFYMKVFGFA
ncbi:CBO0543 family protein [Paenibacillus flagellatus]|uniref:Uncharacterized protein n=1 Tax=Paenibacillus flagellatus TaxID=2211139 RepID=A0A2V5KBX1_9BACL|nr:CBO0543 family protein [Paenibacillus flagellatus]PYI51400.1 hypothetical protein DLM86_25625 [Paenibacillus flagellatus]